MDITFSILLIIHSYMSTTTTISYIHTIKNWYCYPSITICTRPQPLDIHTNPAPQPNIINNPPLHIHDHNYYIYTRTATTIINHLPIYVHSHNYKICTRIQQTQPYISNHPKLHVHDHNCSQTQRFVSSRRRLSVNQIGGSGEIGENGLGFRHSRLFSIWRFGLKLTR